MIKTSSVTGKTYDTDSAIYMSNHMQCFKFLQYFNSAEYLVDILWDSSRRPDALVYVWAKNSATAKCKAMWDRHEI